MNRSKKNEWYTQTKLLKRKYGERYSFLSVALNKQFGKIMRLINPGTGKVPEIIKGIAISSKQSRIDSRMLLLIGMICLILLQFF
jgi:hypothetical protein